MDTARPVEMAGSHTHPVLLGATPQAEAETEPGTRSSPAFPRLRGSLVIFLPGFQKKCKRRRGGGTPTNFLRTREGTQRRSSEEGGGSWVRWRQLDAGRGGGARAHERTQRLAACPRLRQEGTRGAGGSDLRRKTKSTGPPGEGGREEAPGAGQGAEGRGKQEAPSWPRARPGLPPVRSGSGPAPSSAVTCVQSPN